jgi:hypothetical protein
MSIYETTGLSPTQTPLSSMAEKDSSILSSELDKTFIMSADVNESVSTKHQGRDLSSHKPYPHD